MYFNYVNGYRGLSKRLEFSRPIGLAGGINTYGYVGGNPVAYVDPLGLECVSGNGFTTCFTENGPTFRLPTPKGFPASLGPNSAFYHAYDVQRAMDAADAECVMKGMFKAPTIISGNHLFYILRESMELMRADLVTTLCTTENKTMMFVTAVHYSVRVCHQIFSKKTMQFEWPGLVC